MSLDANTVPVTLIEPTRDVRYCAAGLCNHIYLGFRFEHPFKLRNTLHTLSDSIATSWHTTWGSSFDVFSRDCPASD